MLIVASFIFILMGVAVYAAAGNPPEVRIIVPGNNSANSSTNETQTFSFNISTNQTSSDCRLFINDTARSSLLTYLNETASNSTYANQTFPNGRMTWYVMCNQTVDGAALSFSSNNYTFFSDTGLPSRATINTNSPANLANQSVNETSISCTLPSPVDGVFDNLNLTLYLNGTVNQTQQGAIANITYNFTIPFPAIADSGTYNWTCAVVDNATNRNYSTWRTLIVDRLRPTIVDGRAEESDLRTFDRHAGIQLNWSVRDMNYIDSCWAKVYDLNGASFTVNATKNVTTGANQKEIMCSMNFTGDLGTNFVYGRVRIEKWANDTLGNANTTGLNVTNMTILKLFPGWNHIVADRNTTLGAVSNYSSNITQVSFYNNTEKVFTTYVKGVAAQEGVTIPDGTATYVYANQTTFLIRNWSIDKGSVSINTTIRSGWNTVTHLNVSGVKFYEVCDTGKRVSGLTFNNTLVNFTSLSFYMANESRYVSHFCFMKFNNNTVIPFGQAFWVLQNQSDVGANVTTGYRIYSDR